MANIIIGGVEYEGVNAIRARDCDCSEYDTYCNADGAVSDTSTNAIQNKIIKAYVDAEATARQTADNLKVDKTAIKQTTGTSENDVMSQKAVTDLINEFTVNGNVVLELSPSDFESGYVLPDGSLYPEDINAPSNVLHNIFSVMMHNNGAVITPLATDTQFKIVYYDDIGNYLSTTVWLSKPTINNYTINGSSYRLCIANKEASVTTNTIAGHLSKYTVTDNELFVNGQKVLETPITLPFSDFAINEPIYKNEKGYFTNFKPQSKFIKISNGVTVFMKPDGDHDGDGLTINTAVKTLAEALAISNVQTIVLLSGEYIGGINFYNNGAQVVNQDINIIGIGEVIVNNGDNSTPIKFTKNLYCENVHFKKGNNALIIELDSTHTATFNKCKFSDSNTLNGLSVLGGITYVVNCEAYNNAYDGFNYHANATVINHTLEIDCVSYGNGTYNLDGADGQSSNATTSHDGNYIVRINGDYKCCHGGVVADKECKSANYGCKSGVSTITNNSYPDRMSNFWAGSAEMYLYDCVSYGSKYDTATTETGTIVSNVEYTSRYVG